MVLPNCGLRLNSMQKIITDKMKQCTEFIIAFYFKQHILLIKFEEYLERKFYYNDDIK